jgi:acetyl-CoA carboxylase biotin carboxyl carrier protein
VGPDAAALDPALAVEQVLAAVRGTSITELEVEWGDGSLRLTRESLSPPRSTPAEPTAASATAEVAIVSSNVGIFYREPARNLPGLGDWVALGALLGEIETLGMHNSVTSTVAGMIVEILAEHGAPVEYGQPLLVIRPAHEQSDPSPL